MKLLPERIQDLVVDKYNFEPFVLVEIPEESIYLANSSNIVIGQTYYDDLIDDIAPLDQSIKESFGCGYAEISDITITLSNLEKFSDYLISPENRNFKDKYLIIRLLLDKVNLEYENSLIVYRGIIRDYKLNRRQFTFYVEDAITKKHKDLPETTIDDWTGYANDNLSALIPTAIYGDHGESLVDGYSSTLGVKAIWAGFRNSDQTVNFKIADHPIKVINYSFKWIPYFISYIREFAMVGVPAEARVYNIAYRALISHCGHRPSNVEAGNIASNPERCFDKDFSSYATLSVLSNLLRVEFEQLPFWSDFIEDGPSTVTLYVKARVVSTSGAWFQLFDSGVNLRGAIFFADGEDTTKFTTISIPETADMDRWYIDGNMVSPAGLDFLRVYEVWVKHQGSKILSEEDVQVQLEGQPDDANGLITGTADSLIEKQLQVIEGILRNQLSLVDLYYGTDGQTFTNKEFKSASANFNDVKPGDILYLHSENGEKREHIINRQVESGTIEIEDSFNGAPESNLVFQVDRDIANKSIDEVTDAYLFAGQLHDLEYSWNFLDRLAKQSFLRIFEDYLGRTKVNRYDATKDSLMSFNEDNYKLESLKIELSKLNQLINVFRFNYYKNYATGKYMKVKEFNPGNDATCLASANKYGRSKIFKLDCDYIIDTATMNNVAELYRDYFTERYWIIKFTTWLNAVSLEIGDVIDMTDDLLNWSEEKFEIIGFRFYFESGEIEITARSLSPI